MKTALHSAHTQGGSALIGFVVGVLVGMCIALVVAVYVTRVPVPFVDRGVSRSSAQDVKEAERNKGWNPNAQIAGSQVPLPKQPAGAETANTSPVIEPDTPTPADAASSVAPRSTTSSPATAKPNADPLGDLVNAKLGQSAESPGAVVTSPDADPFIYFVQAGAFKLPEEAEAQRAKLAMMGISATVSEREQAGRTVFRVRIGPFNDKGTAQATREQLEVQSVQAALVRVHR